MGHGLWDVGFRGLYGGASTLYSGGNVVDCGGGLVGWFGVVMVVVVASCGC